MGFSSIFYWATRVEKSRIKLIFYKFAKTTAKIWKLNLTDP